MSSTEFYGRRQQFFREWRVLWDVHGLDTLLGGVYVLPGFYFFRDVGFSQVYNVIGPFIIASLIAGYLAFMVCAPQTQGKTLPFYFNLPRARTTTWDAHLAYLVCAVLWIEGAILIGVLFKLGGAGMTPHYRLHPEAFALPFLGMAAVTAYIHVQHTTRNVIAFLLVGVAFVVGLFFWLNTGFLEGAEKTNNYFPPRGFDLSHQVAFSALLLIVAGYTLLRVRVQWQRRQVGEIR
jgi:hypothetical protein